ncbi:MAG: O-antigen ligase family protein, partial [Chloroflexota bacterium]
MTTWEQHAERAPSDRRSLLALAVLAALTSTVTGLLLATINPLFGFAGLLIAAVALGILSNPERATLVVFFVLYSNITVVAIRSGLPSQLAGSFFLLLGLPLFHILIVRRERVIVTPTMILMIGYLATLLLSAAAADRPDLTFTRIQNYLLEGLVLYFLVVNVVRRPETLRRSLWVILLAGALMGGVTLYQGVTRTFDNDFGGFAQITESEVSVGQEDYLGNKPVTRRFAGPIGEKNRYAQILVVLLPLAAALALAERRLALRLAAGAMALLILGGALYTFSRGAGVAVVVMALALLPLRMIRPRSALIAGVLAVILILTLAPGYVYRLSTLGNVSSLLSGDPSEADTSVQGRATENLATLRIFLDHPVLGVGPGQTPRFIRDYGRGIGFKLLDPSRRAHNLY